MTTTTAGILFIDAAVAETDALLVGLDPNLEVIRLSADQDGLSQIAQALAGRTGLEAVHVISHGSSGELQLGSASVDLASLSGYAEELATIRAALAQGADLMLYGCNVAAGAAGQQFLAALAEATGADVAASIDTTGSALLGGNWTLEASTGAIEAGALQPTAYDTVLGADSALPTGLKGTGPWSWGSYNFQTKYDGAITDSDPENPLRAGNKWDRYALDGITAGTRVYVYMGNSSGLDDYLQIDRNGTIVTQNDDGGDGENSFDAFVSWIYQPGDVIRATTYSSGSRGTYSLYIGTSTGAVAQPSDIGNAPPPAPPPATAPTFTDNHGLIGTYSDTGNADSFLPTSGRLTATDTTPTGTLRFSGAGSSPYGTLAVAADGSFTFTPDAAAINALAAGQNANASFNVTVTDGGLSTTKPITVNLVGANDAPTLASNATIAATQEDAATVATSVQALFAPRFADADTGASLGGIVITGNAATPQQGQWQYSTDGGATWHDVGAVTAAAGLALSASSLLRFEPAADWNGVPGSLSVHAADNAYAGGYTSGAVRVSFDTVNDAATSGVSAASRTVSTTVTAVNDAPVFTSPAFTATIEETAASDGAAFATGHTLTGTLTATDIDSPEPTLAFSIRGGVAGSGVWTQVGLYGTLTLDTATRQWTYTPDKSPALNALAEGEQAHDVFEFKVTDEAGASSTQVIDITLVGSNDVPVLAAELGDQVFSGAGAWRFQVPAATFTDAEGQGLDYTAQVVDGNGDLQPLPAWLSFDASTRTFVGDPPPAWNNVGLTLRVTATDGEGASVVDEFSLSLSGTSNEPPRVGTHLGWTAVDAQNEVTQVSFSGALGGTTLVFDGQTVTLGSAATGEQVAATMSSAFAVAGFDAALKPGEGNGNVMVLTDSSGKPVNLAAGTVNVPGGSYTVSEVQARAPAQAEVATVQLSGTFANATTLSFAGQTIQLAAGLSAAQAASAVAAAIAGGNAQWTAVVDSTEVDKVVLTARTTGLRTDLSTSDFQATQSNALAAELVNVDTVLDGDAQGPEVVFLSFNAAFGATSLSFDGLTIALTNSMDPQAVANDFVAALEARGGTANWVLIPGGGGGSVSISSRGPGDVPNLTSASFVAYEQVPAGSLATGVVIDTQGAVAVDRMVEVSFTGSYGGADITLGGVTGSAGSTATAADVADAVAGAGFPNHTVVRGADGSVTFTANEPGAQTDLQPSDFGGSYTGTVSTQVTAQGADWTYTVPAGTFVDPEGGTLSYSAWVIDPATGLATELVDSAALNFNEATRTFSGNGLLPASTLIEVRATDGSATVSSQFQLVVYTDTQTPSLVAGVVPATVDFASGSGTGSFQLPATAFSYLATAAEPLAYSAVVVDGDGVEQPWPAWLSFDAATGTFSGNPPNGAGDLLVQVTASTGGITPLLATTPSFTLAIANANDPLVVVAPIADQYVVPGGEFGLNVSAPFGDPDGTAAGTASSAGISYTATANGRPLSDFGLDLVVNPNGSLTFSGNPSAAEASLVIVITGTEDAGGSTATTSFTLNLNDPILGDALSANNPGAVTISGAAIEGQTLTASVPTDADGLNAGQVRYQWQVSSDNGATWHDVDAGPAGTRGQSATLELAQSEAGKQVRVQTFYNDLGGVAESPVSDAVSVANVDSAGSVSIQGILTPGETLNAVISDADGVRGAMPTYQWFRDGTPIEGATYNAYTLTNADGGAFISVQVGYVDDFETVESPSTTTATRVQLGIVPPSAQDDTGVAVEAGGVNNALGGSNASGNLLANDTDPNGNIDTAAPIASVRAGGVEGVGEAATLAGEAYTVAGQFGTLTVNRATGAWSYVVDQDNAEVEALTDGQTLADRFNYTVIDDTGLSDTAVLSVTINGTNDAPTLRDVPAVAQFTEDVAEAIRTSFAIVDPDGGSSFTLRLTVTQGTLRGEAPQGVVMDGVTVTGTDTSVLTIAGTSMGAVQNWLATVSLLYTSAPNERGDLNAVLTYAVRDGEGPFMDAGTTALNVESANNPPVIDVGGAGSAGNNHVTTFRPRGDDVAVVAADVNITDIDAEDLIVSATVTLTAGAFDNAFGTLYETLRSTAGTVYIGASGNEITITGNGSTQIVLSGLGTHADYEAALRTVVYNNSNPNAFSGDRTITISVTDAESAVSNTGSFATAEPNALIAVGQRIFIDGVDSGFTVGRVIDSQHFVASGPLEALAPGVTLAFYGAGSLVTTATQSGPIVATTTVLVPWTPVIDMNGTGAGRDHAVTFTEGQAGVRIATADASITDQDGNIHEVVVTLANPLDGAAEHLFIAPALVSQLNALGITVAGNGTAAITLGYNPATRPGGLDATFFQVGLRGIQYVNTSEMPDTTQRVVHVTSTDMAGNTGVDARTTINVVAVNDAPAGTDTTLTVVEDGSYVLSIADFGFSDVDGNAFAAVFIDQVPAWGGLSLDGVAVEAGQRITAADIADGKLIYNPPADRSEMGFSEIAFRVQDDGGTALGGLDTDGLRNIITFDVTPVNDAPVLTPGAPSLETIDEDAVFNGGQTIASLLGEGGTGVADADTLNNGGAGNAPEGTGRGVAITGLHGTGGTWEYSVDGGESWMPVFMVAEDSALLLRASDRIRFVPDETNGSSASIDYVLWDGSTGTAGGFADVTTRGGSTAFSVDGDTATLEILEVNDAPTGADVTLIATEDTTLTLGVADFGFADIDGNALSAVTIVTLPAEGTLVLDGVAVTAGQSVPVQAIVDGLLQFVPAAEASGAARASFSFRVQDDGGTANGGVDLATSANTVTVDITPVNDAPVMTPAAPSLPAISEEAVANAGLQVSDFVGNGEGSTAIADTDTLNNGGAGHAPEGTGRGIAIHSLESDGPAGSGTWQYRLDGSGTWIDITGVGPDNALLLGANDRIRFVPDQANGLTASFSYYLWDGSLGTAGAQVDASERGGNSAFSTGSDTASLVVTPVNDAPVVDLNGAAPGADGVAIFRPRGEAVAVVSEDIRITDADRIDADTPDLLVSASVRLTAGALDNLFGTTYETLASTAGSAFEGSLGTIAITGNGTGENGLVGATELSFSGHGTHADYEAALRTVVYDNTNPNAFTGDRTVEISVRDASMTTGDAQDGLDSAIVTATIQVPWTPVVDMNGEAADGRNAQVTFTERTTGVAIAASDASIVDQDGNIAQVVITITNPLDGASERLFVNPTLIAQFASIGITVTGNGTHSITLTGNRDGSAFQLALRAIQYVNDSASPSLADRVVSVSTLDVDGNTGVGASTTIHIAAINDAPVGSDGTVTLDEDTAYTFAVADFGFTDAEGHALVSVVISSLPGSGQLTLDGVAVEAGQEVSVADIAAGLLRYEPAQHANNVQNPLPSFGFQVRDAGGTANGGIDLDATPSTLTLDITPVNDLPTGTDSASPSVAIVGSLREGQTLTAAFDIADVDRTPEQIAAASSYRWETRAVPDGEWTAIAGAGDSLYLLAGSDVNREIRVVVTYADTHDSDLVYTSDLSTRPAIVGNVDGDITLTIDTPTPVLIVDPEGDVTFTNPGGGPLTVDGLPHGGTLTVESAGPTTLSNPEGDVTVNNAGPGPVTVTGLDDDATVNTGGNGPTTIADPEGDLTIHNAGPGTVTVTGLDPETTVTTSGNGPVVIGSPEGELTLDNQGPGTVTIDGPVADTTLTIGGNGPTTVADPAGDLDLVNNGGGYVTVTGMPDDSTLHASGTGDVYVSQPDGDLTLVNDLTDGGDLFVDRVIDGASVNVSGSGPTTVSNPAGDIDVVNAGPGPLTVRCLLDGKTITTSGAGDVNVTNPRGSVVLENAGPGATTIEGVNVGQTVTVSGEGTTTVANPDGDVIVHNDGPGRVDVTGVPDGAAVSTSGEGPITIDANGSLSVVAMGPGAVSVNGLNDGESLDVLGSGDVAVADPDGDFALTNTGSGTVTVTGAGTGSTIDSSGTGTIVIADPQGGLTLNNAGPADVTVSGLADDAVLVAGGSADITLADPVGDVAVANTGTGTVSVSGMQAGDTLTVSGSGPVAVVSDLAAGERFTIDTTGNSNVQISNLGAGIVDVVGGLALDTGDGLRIRLNGDGTTAITVAGEISLDGTPITLELEEGYDPSLHDSITLLDNDGNDAVTGHFANLAEGETLYVGGELFRITYTGGTGNDVVLTRVNDAPSGAVSVSGTARQHETLTASHMLGDTDGMGTVTYQWYAGTTLLAAGASYVITQAAVGQAIHVVASYTDQHGTVETVASAATAAVANVNDAPTGGVSIDGTATLGRTLVASHTLADLDGLGTVSWQWQADGVDIAGATGDRYTLGLGDIGKVVTAVASYTDGYGQGERVSSAGTARVADGNNVPRDVESQVPGLGGGSRGDGNGDGVQDSLQPAVASLAVAGQGGASSGFVTLVVDSVDGKVRDGSLGRLADLHANDTNLLPSWAQAPAGAIGFTAETTRPDGIEHFSLYVDNNLGINGFWAVNADGVLVNLASEPYGGRMVVEGDKLRLDFQIADGGEFDRGASGDSLIVSDGVAARAELGLIGHVADKPVVGGADLWD